MTEKSREQRLNEAFVHLADTLVDAYDVVGLLHALVEECTVVLDVEAGGLLLVDQRGDLHVMASTSEEVGLVEIMQLDAGVGPCVESFRTGLPVSVPDIDAVGHRWPEFCRVAVDGGFRSMYATPLRLPGEIIGAMNLFRTRVGGLDECDIATARALADVATIGILHERLLHERDSVSGQLRQALDSRIVIEQAKGVVFESRRQSMDDAFATLRNHARSHRMTLKSVAEAVISRQLDAAKLQPAPQPYKIS